MTRSHHLRPIRRFAAVAVGLAAALAAFGAVPASALKRPGRVPNPAPPTYPCSPECSPTLGKHPVLPLGHLAGPVSKVPAHTVVVGGMPGWQIVLIAIGAALCAATAAVLFDRAKLARKLRTTTA